MKCFFAYKTHLIIIVSHNLLSTVNILHTLNLDTTRSQIASIVKVKIANFKCTGLMLRTLANPIYIYYRRCDYVLLSALSFLNDCPLHAFIKIGFHACTITCMHHTPLYYRYSSSQSCNWSRSGPAGLVECPLFGSCPGQLSWPSWLSSGGRCGQRGLCG